MLTNERHEKILKILKTQKNISVKEISSLIFASEATVRRDFIKLQKLGLIQRTHGGATLASNAEEVSLFVRMVKNSKEKEAIATLALERLPKFNSLFIDSSSTALALAERMNLEHKTVVTYSLQTAIQLAKKNNVNLFILGGKVNYDTLSTTGSITTMQVNDFCFDLIISSCSAIKNGEVFESSMEQKIIKQNALKKSSFKILLADHTKFKNTAPHKSSELKNYDLVICNKHPETDYEIKNLVF